MLSTADYVGIPYADKGRDVSAGLDCWGLVRLFYARQFDIELPSLLDGYGTLPTRERAAVLSAAEIAAHWTAVAEPVYGDVVVLTVLRRPFHVGVVLDGLHGRFLHTLNPAQGSVIERLESPVWAQRIEGFYRHVERS